MNLTTPMAREKRQVVNLAAAQSSKIMIIDDERLVAKTVRKHLRQMGVEQCTIVSESRNALGAIREERPDLVLLDVMMPEIDGLEILESIRASDDLGLLPVLMLTSASDRQTKHWALRLGASDFLTKPVDPSELMLRIHNLLAARAYIDQAERPDK